MRNHRVLKKSVLVCSTLLFMMVQLQGYLQFIAAKNACTYTLVKQHNPFTNTMAQHRTASSSGPDSEVLYLKDKGHYFEDSNVYIMAREDKWCEREVKETVYIKLE